MGQAGDRASSGEIAALLQRVVGRTGLAPGRLAVRSAEMEPLFALRCVRARAGGDDPGELARSLTAVVREAVARLGESPTRQAVELLLGVGRTRGQLRKERRRAAAAYLGISDEHLRKTREYQLLQEVADEVLGLEAEVATGEPPTAVAAEPSGEPAAVLVPGDDTRFIADVSIPDGSTVRTGAQFTKVWEIENSGTVRWVGRSLERIGPSDAEGLCRTPARIPIATTQPGARIRIEAVHVAPDGPGTSRTDWKMVDHLGRYCFPRKRGLYCIVHVVD